MKIKVKTPAKINLSLKVCPVRKDDFHPIESVMQSVSLFDFLTISLGGSGIILDGNSAEIPYDEHNIVFRATQLFLNEIDKQVGVKIYIEKNIPVCAGLAGGSTNAAGVLWGLNKIFNEPLGSADLHNICARLGSDLNFCLVGGKACCLGRGEIIEPLPFEDFALTVIKPKNLAISAKEAYEQFDKLEGTISNLSNDLEFALLPYYKELQFLHNKGFQMSGSGPSFFILEDKLSEDLIENRNGYEIFEGLKAVPYGVCEA